MWNAYKKIVNYLNQHSSPSVEFLEYHADQVELEKQPFPFVLRLSAYTILLIVAVGFIWACIAKVDKVVVARGRIISTAQTIKIQPLGVAIIKKFEVGVGQIVKPGQVLARLDSTFSQADLQRLALRKNSLYLQKIRLEAELKHQDFSPPSTYTASEIENQWTLFNGRSEEYKYRLEAYTQNIKELQSSLTSSEQQHEDNVKQIAILKELEAVYEGLYKKGSQSLTGYLNAKYQRVSKQSDITRFVNEVTEKRQTMARIQAERNAFLNKWQNDISTELTAVNKEYDELNEEIAKASRLHTLTDLVAPQAAVVLEFGAFSEGSVAREGESVMTLVPIDVPLEAEVFIDPSEIGYIQPHDSCRLKLDTLPFQKHGTITGTLRTITDDAVRVEGHDTPYYKGRISLDTVDLSLVPNGFRLLPGMSLNAEIKVGTRRVITFFTYPLIRTFDEGMREP